MAPDPSDFFSAGLRFIGSVLDLLTQQRSGVTVWTSEDISTQSMALMPEGPVLTAASPSMQQRVHDEIAALKQIDPDFNELQFLAQVTGVYQTYLSCDADMNVDGMTAFATPDLIAGYRTRVARWKSAGLCRIVHDMKMVGSAIIKVSLDGTRQAIVVRFLSSGVRFTQDIDSRTATDGSSRPDSFTEFATFVRPEGTSTAKSEAAGGLSHCPSCGAPSTAGAATCAFCGTNITGTGGTWLLDKTSESAYT